ncbi:uncharacterized protein LOC134722295 [Mytilus trossulus]|uniref:uncharacterized protein LOC134722295 n=1 Tax=Mytilus trossulus TaxID=6551 RepID=UPI003007E23F
MHYGEKTLLLILLSQITCCSFQKSVERKKQIPVAPHTDNYKDTLLWTIELKHNNSEHVKQIPGHSHDLQDDLFRFGNIYIQNEGQTESDRNLARKVAPECNLTFLGHIGHLKNIYLFGHALSEHTEKNTTHKFINVDFKTLKSVIDDIETKLDNHDNVVWFHREKVFSREKRRIQFRDPAYNQQWHLNNYASGMDINVTGVWEHNITGLGITVSVVDDVVDDCKLGFTVSVVDDVVDDGKLIGFTVSVVDDVVDDGKLGFTVSFVDDGKLGFTFAVVDDVVDDGKLSFTVSVGDDGT